MAAMLAYSFLWYLALHAEMTEGLLAPAADYASKPLRDELKRAELSLIYPISEINVQI
jgi:hypothetical protein